MASEILRICLALFWFLCRRKATLMKSYYFPLFGSFLFLASCGMNQSVSIDTIRPADIDLPNHLNSIVLVDRTEFDRQFWNVGEALATGELPEADKAAVQQSVVRLREILNTSPRFQDIKISPYRLKGNSFSTAFPEALSWSTIYNLCKRHKVDAVLAIEIFDTDFLVTESIKNVKKTVKTDSTEREITVPKYYAKAIGNIKMGIRLYDLQGEQIIDQQIITDQRRWEGTADSKAEAVAKLINASRAQQVLSAEIGKDYAYKIAPLPVTISRRFYGKAKKSRHVEAGARYAKVSDWRMAIERWKQGLKVAPDKECGKLCYNLALAYEVQGNLAEALKWAQRGYATYDNKPARQYSQILMSRQRTEEILDYQFE